MFFNLSENKQKEKSMNQLISDLSNPGARSFLYIPSSLTLEQAILYVTNQINKIDPTTEILIATLGKLSPINLTQVSNFQISQISQAFLDIFFGIGSPRPLPPRILIIETSFNLGQFIVPREIGRILTIGSPFKSIEDLTQTSRFLSGPSAKDLNISPLDVTIFLGKIGYQFIAPEFSYQGNTITINMTSLQYKEYLSRLSNEESLNRSEPFSALQALNMIYPSDLQKLHNLPREQRPKITPDLLSEEEGWINQTIDIKSISPKINWLIEYLRLNLGKHIIYTAFNESNGVQAISSFLRLSGFNVITITGNDKQQNRYNKITTFNEAKTQIILISNLYAFKPLENVMSFIMFEQHSSENIFNSYLRQIASTIGSTRSLPIIFLISVGPQNQSTLDIENYTQMAIKLNLTFTIFKILKSGEVTSSQIKAFNIPNLSENIFKNENGGPLRFKDIYF